MLLYDPVRYFNESIVYDQQLKQLCCGEAGMCDLFYERRPADNCELYEPHSWGELVKTPRILFHLQKVKCLRLGVGIFPYSNPGWDCVHLQWTRGVFPDEDSRSWLCTARTYRACIWIHGHYIYSTCFWNTLREHCCGGRFEVTGMYALCYFIFKSC